jgi:uncharacterized membrane protein
MSIAAAQIIVFLALLSQVFAFELATVVFYGTGEVLESVVAVAHVEYQVLVQFQ